MKKSKTVLSVMSFATVLAALSLSGLANAQVPSGEPTRAPHPEYFEQKADRPEKPDCDDGKQPGEMKSFEHKQRAKHAEFKAYIDSLPEAERDYIKSEFKAIREDREANMRRMDALKERLDMHRPELREKMNDRDSNRGVNPDHERFGKGFNGKPGACMMKGQKPHGDVDHSLQEHGERSPHGGYDRYESEENASK